MEFFLCGWGIHKQVSIYDKLIKCLHNLEGESLYYPWLSFSFMQENEDGKGEPLTAKAPGTGCWQLAL